jgi:hypothetical protein
MVSKTRDLASKSSLEDHERFAILKMLLPTWVVLNLTLETSVVQQELVFKNNAAH